MADAAKWIVAGEPATGYPEGMLLRALEGNQHEAMAERMDNDSVATALGDYLNRQPYFGSVSDLFRLLKLDDRVEHDRSFPKTAQHLSKKLKQLRPAMIKVGINIDFPPRDKDGQKVCIWKEAHGNTEAAKKLAKKMAEEKEKASKF
jgi:hypothetical protein